MKTSSTYVPSKRNSPCRTPPCLLDGSLDELSSDAAALVVGVNSEAIDQEHMLVRGNGACLLELHVAGDDTVHQRHQQSSGLVRSPK